MTLRVVLEADGGARGNPGPAGYGAVIRDAATGQILVERAAAIGLVNHVVPDDQVLSSAIECANKIAKLPKQAVEDTRRVMNLHMQRAVMATIDYALTAEYRSFDSEELRANIEKMAK